MKLLKKYHFKPKLFTSFVFILVLALLLFLGFWQLDRAKFKQNLQQDFDNRQKAAPLNLEALKNFSNLNKLQYNHIRLQGTYLNKQQFLLDNKTYHGKVGYQVLTPFKPDHSDQLVIINRGWIALGKSRDELPNIKPVEGQQIIQGLIKLPPKKAFVLKKQHFNSNNHWPIRVQTININTFTKLLNKPLYPIVILLDKSEKHGFVRDWQAVTMKAAKHVGYAVQWFALAFTLIVIYIVVNFKRKEN